MCSSENSYFKISSFVSVTVVVIRDPPILNKKSLKGQIECLSCKGHHNSNAIFWIKKTQRMEANLETKQMTRCGIQHKSRFHKT